MKLFEIMSFMAENDLDITRAENFVSGQSTKRGAHITMGTDLNTLINIQTDKYIPVLFCLNKEQYKLLLEDNNDLELLKSKK